MKFNNVKKIQQMNKILGTFMEDSEIERLNFSIWFLEQDLEFTLWIDRAVEPPESSSGPDILKGKSENINKICQLLDIYFHTYFVLF